VRKDPTRIARTVAVCGFALLASAAAPVTTQGLEAWGTFSITALDSVTGEIGVAVQSRVYGVGPRVAWVQAGIGAIATQASSNEAFGPDGLRMMAAGMNAQETLDWLLAHDAGRDSRQVGVVDAEGGVAHWTGAECMDWAGHAAGAAFTCQGNILASEEVVSGMVAAFEKTAGLELGQRLIAALEAAQAAGGDKRGQQSAAILIGRHHPEFPEYDTRYVDVRIEDHSEPIAELRRLYEMYEAQGLAQAHMRFAQLYEAEGDSAGARREHERVGETMVRLLESGTEDAGMLNALAWFSAIHDVFLEEALVAAQRAVALEPENSNILDTQAEVHFRLGQVPEAIAVATKALEMSPDDTYLTYVPQLARGISSNFHIG